MSNYEDYNYISSGEDYSIQTERHNSLSDVHYASIIVFLVSYGILPVLLILIRNLMWKNVPKLDIFFAWSSLATWTILVFTAYLVVNDKFGEFVAKPGLLIAYIIFLTLSGLVALIANMFHSSNVWKCCNNCFTCGQNVVPMYPIPRSQSKQELMNFLKKVQETGPTLVTGRMLVTGTRRLGDTYVRLCRFSQEKYQLIFTCS